MKFCLVINRGQVTINLINLFDQFNLAVIIGPEVQSVIVIYSQEVLESLLVSRRCESD